MGLSSMCNGSRTTYGTDLRNRPVSGISATSWTMQMRFPDDIQACTSVWILPQLQSVAGHGMPYYTFQGVYVFSLLPGRVYSKVDSFQIILHCPQLRATEAASLALLSEGGSIDGGLHYQIIVVYYCS